MTTANITFQVQTDRILELLSKQIYDSPYAMVRENVQNAYDAILLRADAEQKPIEEYEISITLAAQNISITDNGIGMSEDVLRNNFWKAGSSGKNNAAARAAGVIGTFGIGAMANFGVCSSLTVQTRAFGSEIGLRSHANKADLNIGHECITLENLEDSIPIGTTLTAQLESDAILDLAGLIGYLTPFVQFLPVPLIVNGTLISTRNPRATLGVTSAWKSLGEKLVSGGLFRFKISAEYEGNSIALEATDFIIDGNALKAYLCLKSGGGNVMGLRSRFGLAPLPQPSVYQWSGFADLPFLVPTAGREALTRETIAEAAQIFPIVDGALSELIAEMELAETLASFQQFVLNSGRMELAKRVLIQVQDGDERVEMGKLRQKFDGLEMQSYAGTDPDIIRTFSSQERPLLRISQSQPRRNVQIRYLTQILNIAPIPDSASIIETYSPNDLTTDEFSMTLAIARVLRFDYLLDDVEIVWAKISHGVPMIAAMKNDRVTITVSRSWPALISILRVIGKSYDLLDALAKDFVRAHLYQRISGFVPSSQRVGLDALQKALERKKELYRLEENDRGALEPIFAEYLAGNVNLGQVLTAATKVSAGHTQKVTAANIGSIENVLPDVVNNAVIHAAPQVVTSPTPGSPILRLESEISQRLLIATHDIPQLNNHKVFLALSDRLFAREKDFFLYPHSTQVAWAGRRIVYLFSVANSGYSIYYDIELRGSKFAGEAGGTAMPTTTIVSSNRIFVPVPPQLESCFQVTDSPVEFYVRFDLLTHLDEK